MMNGIKKLLLSCFLLFAASHIFGQLPQRPSPTKLVNDFTNTLTAEQANALEQKLVSLDDSTFTQIAVVIVKSVNGQTIADYNAELLRKWGVGSSTNNSGVILLIAKDDRKLDITVGYGLEGALTDATSKQIIDDIIVPNFKGNDYYRGIDEGTDAIIRAVKGEYKTARQKSSGKSSGFGRIGFFIFIIIMILVFSGRGGRGGGGTFMSRRGNTGIAEALLWSTLLGGGRGGGGGGGWSGGGGGGFGGFGGGSGGGGGASGSW